MYNGARTSVALERRCFEADATVRALEQRCAAAEAEAAALRDVATSEAMHAEAASALGARHGKPQQARLEEELANAVSQRRAAEGDRDDLAQQVAQLGREAQARARAVKALERALGDVTVTGTGAGSKGTTEVTKKDKGKGLAAVADKALERCRLLALKLSQATLDAANWQQEARDLTAQLERGPQRSPPATPFATARGDMKPSASEVASGGEDFDESDGDSDGGGRPPSKTDSSPVSARSQPQVQSELQEAMASLAAQVSQIRAAFTPSSPSVPDGRQIADNCNELREAAERCAAQAAAAEHRLQACDRERQHLGSERRQLLERISHLQHELLGARQKTAQDGGALAAAVDTAAGAASALSSAREGSAVCVSPQVLLRLDHLLAKAADDAGSEAHPDTDPDPEAITFPRLAGRVASLQVWRSRNVGPCLCIPHAMLC
jgi:chromosome segregation ATPase